MAGIAKVVEQMRSSPASIGFADLLRVCIHYFGAPRHNDGSHAVFKMPWAGDPRINLQNDKGKGKPYQVKQALEAIDRLSSLPSVGAAAPSVVASPAAAAQSAVKGAKARKGKTT